MFISQQDIEKIQMEKEKIIIITTTTITTTKQNSTAHCNIGEIIICFWCLVCVSTSFSLPSSSSSLVPIHTHTYRINSIRRKINFNFFVSHFWCYYRCRCLCALVAIFILLYNYCSFYVCSLARACVYVCV